MASPSATAHLVYGVLVQTADLVAAALAFPKLAGPRRALKLIRLRQARRKLRTETGLKQGALNRVPREVWASVEQALIDVEVKEARLELLVTVGCEQCQLDRALSVKRELVGAQPGVMCSEVAHMPFLWDEMCLDICSSQDSPLPLQLGGPRSTSQQAD